MMTTKKKKLLFIIFFTTIVASVPLTVGTYFLISNKKGYKNINTTYINNNILSSMNVDNDTWNKVKKNIFENENEIFFKDEILDSSFSTVYNNVLIIKNTDKNYDFTKLKLFLKNVNIRTLDLNDLYFYFELAGEFNIALDEIIIENILEKHWDARNNLFFKDSTNDPLSFKLVITYIWSKYLRKNNSTFITKIKNNISKIVNSASFFNSKEESLFKENQKYFILLASSLKIDISTNLEKFNNLYINWKNEILKTDMQDKITFIKSSTFFLLATDNYFPNENTDIKNKLTNIFNTANEQEIENFSKQDLEFSIFRHLDQNKISNNFFIKLSENTKKTTQNFANVFSFKPNIEKTFYLLLTFKSLNIDINREKIANFINHYERFLNYSSLEKNYNQLTKEILYNEKIKFLINYKNDEKEKFALESKLNLILSQENDYRTIFNILLTKLINNEKTIATDFYNYIKEIIVSFNQLKADDKNNITIYIYILDTILDLNLISEKELERSLNWILENKSNFDYSDKNTIYYYFSILNLIKDNKIKQNISEQLNKHKEKILNSVNNEEEMFFIDSILKFLFDNNK